MTLNRFTFGATPPKPMGELSARLPDSAATPAISESTTIIARVKVLKTGNVSEVQILQPSSRVDINEFAVASIKALIFEPAKTDANQPVDSYVKIPFTILIRKENQPENTGLVFTSVIEERPLAESLRKTLRPKEAEKLAGSQGDPIKAIQNFPGVARSSFGSGQLSIRGAAPFDSRYFLDDLEIPILFHFGGLRTVFNGSIIDAIDFVPGGFSARYGSATGGIVSTFTRKPNKDRFHLLAEVNTFDSQLLIEGPITKNLSFLSSVRRSYIDIFLRALLKSSSGFSLLVAPRYYDYQNLILWEPTSTTTHKWQLYGSDDKLEFLLSNPSDTDPSLRGDFKNHTLFHRLTYQLSTKLASKASYLSRVGAGYNQILFNTSNGPYLSLSIWQWDIRQESLIDFDDRLSLNLGLDYTISKYRAKAKFPSARNSAGVFTPFSSQTLLTTLDEGTLYEGGPYLAFKTSYKKLDLQPSIRLDTGNSGTDVVTVDPRMGLKLHLAENTNLKGAWGIFHQRPQPQESAPTLGNPSLKPKYAIHYVMGVDHQIDSNCIHLDPLTLDWQLFYRDLHKQIAATGTSSQYDNTGSGYSIGSEWYIKYGSPESINGWISYTLSKNRVQNRSDLPDYPSQYDQTHILTLLGNIPFWSKWEFGWRFRYVTGNPNTPVIGSAYSADGDSYTPVRGDFYSQRLPDFHQLDVRIQRRWEFTNLKLTAFLEINNLYNRKNPEGVTYSFDYRAKEYVTGLPILPILGVRGEL